MQIFTTGMMIGNSMNIGMMIGKFRTMHGCQVLYFLTLDATIVEKLSEMSTPSH